MGDALCPLPEPLRKRILNLEFVDMADLQPEAWLFEDATDKSIASIFKKRKEPITDILVWVQCFNAMVAVLSEQYPQYIQHFLAYQSHIVRAYRKSQGLEWVAYDMAYRRKAAYTKNLNWAVIDLNLSAMWLSGSGRPPLCMHCLSENHLAAHCPHTGDNLLSSLAPQWATPLPASTSQWAMSPYRPGAQPSNPQRSLQPPSYVTNPPGRPGPSHNQWQPITCGLYNASEGPRCNYDPCKFAHCCRTCGGSHPASMCRLSQHPKGIKRPFRGQGPSPPAKGRRY